MTLVFRSIIAFSLFSLSFLVSADSTKETSEYFSKIKENPQKLLLFLRKMPKGGDLHTHINGAVYVENLVTYDRAGRFCLDDEDFTVSQNPECEESNKLKNVKNRSEVYNQLIDQWSLRGFLDANIRDERSAYEHFFEAIDRFLTLVSATDGLILAEMMTRAADQNVSYLEVMITPDDLASGVLAQQVPWGDNFSVMESEVLQVGMKEHAIKAAEKIKKAKETARKELACDSENPKAGCEVEVRFLYQILRDLPPTMVFGQLVSGFIAADHDPASIVGINLVNREDGVYTVGDYDKHMAMITFFKERYPQVNVTLHAGEFAAGRVPPEYLRSHIQDAINLGQAQRIGHGVSVAHENDAAALLKQMAEKEIMVEINLTSNNLLLAIKGDKHPLRLYMDYGVPVALSTDDEGFFRTDMTHEYLRAVLEQGITYEQLKQMARNSLAYSFIPGKSLWNKNEVVSECQNIELGAEQPEKLCGDFLKNSEKAQLQWKLEKAFKEFEGISWE